MSRHLRIQRRKARNLLVIALTLLLPVAPLTAWAALDAYMWIIGADQGPIEGEVTTKNLETSIEVKGYGYNLSADYDQASGLPTGERQHRPVRVLKEVDKSSARLMKALIDGENLTSVVIRFFRPTGGGILQQHFTLELTNARIVGITPTHSSTEEDAATPFFETVSFTFQTIVQTFEPDGSTSSDTWQAPPP
jgi:type VI secretion system secreted protein Hcp